MKELYTNSIDRAIKFAELNCAGLYMLSGFVCSCGNDKAKILSCKEYRIYVCPCSQYALKSKQI